MFLGPHGAGRPGIGIEQPRFLNRLFAFIVKLHMTLRFVLDGLHHKTHRVDVFYLAPGPQFIGTYRAHRYVSVAAHGALVHVPVAGFQIPHDRTKLA